MRVPFEPTAFPSAGRKYLAYELYLTNFSGNPLTLSRIEVLDGDTSGARPIAVFEGKGLDAQLQPLGIQTPADGGANTHQLPAWGSVVVFMWVAFEPEAHVPNHLRHRALTGDATAESAAIG